MVWSFSGQYPPQNLLRSWDWWVSMTQMPSAALAVWSTAPGGERRVKMKGQVVNHLQTTHYRLGLKCDRCYSCPSTMSDTLCCHGWHDCYWPRESIPSKSVHLLNPQEYTTASATTPHKEAKMEWSTQAPLEKRPAGKVLPCQSTQPITYPSIKF